MLNEILRLLRVFHDLKLNELAEQLDISTSYLSEIENGKKQPSLDIIRKYANVFKTSPSSILLFSEQIGKNKSGKDLKSILRKKTIQFLQSIEDGSK